MIYLITGQPGHGKTLRAMELALEFQSKGRDVFVSGVRGLRTGEAGFFDLADPTKWPDLPDGAVIVLDECYTAFPRRAPGAKVPPHVDEMARHRHRGFDFILICQQAKQQIDGFLLGLVDRHEHVRRRFGLQKSVILYWDKFNENTTDSATKKLWSFPKSVMRRNLYESTVQDTTQRAIPWFFYALPVALLVLILLLWKTWAWFHPPGVKASDLPMVQASGQPQGEVFGKGASSRRPADLLAWLKPRLPGQPWSAPAYDERPVVAQPEVYCLAVEDGRCGCITEQGTRYAMPLKLCRAMVYNGGSYNPTRRPLDSQRRDDQQRGQVDQPSGDPSAPSAAVGVVGVSGGVNHRAGVGADYAGPEYQHWAPDPPRAPGGDKAH